MKLSSVSLSPFFSRIAMGFRIEAPIADSQFWHVSFATPGPASLDRKISRQTPSRDREDTLAEETVVQVSRVWSAPWLHKETSEKRDWLPRLWQFARDPVPWFCSGKHNALQYDLFRRVCLIRKRHEILREYDWDLFRSSLTISPCRSSCRLLKLWDAMCLKHLCVHLNIEKFE